MIQKIFLSLFVLFSSAVIIAMEASVPQQFGWINFTYKMPDGEAIKQAVPLIIPATVGDPVHDFYVTHKGMPATLLAIELGSELKSAVEEIEESHKKKQLEVVQARLFLRAAELETKLLKMGLATSMKNKFLEMIVLMKSLANNITKHKEIFGRLCGCPRGSLNVTTGGAKDIGHFKQMVNKGNVPDAQDFTMEGFLSEFDLSLGGSSSKDYLSFYPETAIDMKNQKLFVQLAMATNITKENFNRKPLDLIVILDISGSMGASDGTEKSRLEWCKDIIHGTISRLKEHDKFSLIIFNDNVETLIPSKRIGEYNKDALRQCYQNLTPSSATDLYGALKHGYQSCLGSDKFENRILLISDAGHNVGTSGHEPIMNLINNYSENGIGLTAIGIGDDFREDLIHKITMSRGGNYLFVHSGEAMAKLFDQMDYLVTPIAHDLKVELIIDNSRTRLTKTYGIPTQQKSSDILNVSSLFLTSSGGGAMVLELDLLRPSEK